MPPPQQNARVGRFLGFTLAEVLITLGIIGVVAALTMPALIAKHQEQQTISQLLKAYSTLSQAWQRVETEYGSFETWGLENTNTGQTDTETGDRIYNTSAQSLFAERIKPYLNVLKTCKLGEICDNRPEYEINGEKISDGKVIKNTSDSPAVANFFLNDGTFIQIGWYSSIYKKFDISVILPTSKRIILGKTKFYFEVTEKGVIPEGIADTSTSSAKFENNCKKSGTGRGCTAWVIYNRNMDYLHCDGLSWTGKKSCKE